jgi:protein-disulfide isomerase
VHVNARNGIGTAQLAGGKRRRAALAAAGCGIAAALVLAACGGSELEPAPAPPPAAATGTASGGAPPPQFEELVGIPQDDDVLGDPAAPVTLVEYADLQCPFCAEWADLAFPEVVDRYVKTGQVRLVFHGLASLGPDSEVALRTVVAAGAQDRLWEMVELLYANQGEENSGWVTDELVRRIGLAIPNLDVDQVFADRDADWVTERIEAWEQAAREAGIDSTPSFAAGPTGGAFERVEIGSLDVDGIAPALDGLLGG